MNTQRLTKYLEKQQAQMRIAGFAGARAISLTPGQYAELQSEAGESWDGKSFMTCQGRHEVRRIECNVRATGDNVVLCARDDLFFENEDSPGMQVFNENEVTSIPENIGCCEVLSVGGMVDSVKPGDIAFIDFFDVKQGYVVANGDCYIAPGDAFKGLWNPKLQRIEPLDNYVVTRRATDRFATALSGMAPEDFVVPAYKMTDGVVTGRTSKGTVATTALYEEVLAIGKLTARPRPGVMTRAERQLLDLACAGGYQVSKYDEYGPDEAAAINAIKAERAKGREADFKVGDLVPFCKETSTQIRVRGEFQHLVHYDRVLALIDDAAIVAVARARKKLAPLIVGV